MATVMQAREAEAMILRGEAPDNLTVEGSLSFGPLQFPPRAPYTAFTHLPDNLTVQRLEITRCVTFRAWPRGLHCKRLIVTECPVGNLPDDIVVENALELRTCDNMTDLPAITVRKLTLASMKNIIQLPPGFTITDELEVTDHSRLISLPTGMRLKSLTIARCDEIAQLPDNLDVERLTLVGWRVLRALPDNLSVTTLSLYECDQLERLPPHLRVSRQLTMRNCTQIEALPDGFSVPAISIQNSPRLAALPDDLEVTEWLMLSNCAQVRTLPPDLRPTQALIVSNCPELERLPDGLRLPLLKVKQCRKLRAAPNELHVTQTIDFTDCSSLEELPAGLTTDTLILTNCASLTALPESLQVTNLTISGCTALSAWPQSGLAGVRNLELRGCTSLTDWPDTGPAEMYSLDMRGCSQMRSIPPWLRQVHHLNISDCGRITELPEWLRVTGSLDIGGAGLRSLPPSRLGFRLRWRGVAIDARTAFYPQTLKGRDVLRQRNVEVRRVMLERVGYERFLQQVRADVIDEDQDAGGQRRLVRVEMERDEPLVCLAVRDPSTGRQYLLRVPPTIYTCRHAAAWIAGFSDPDAYHPIIET